MDMLKVKLQYCYGIKSLEHDFIFSNGRAHIIYAPNGAMKTSFANTFKKVCEGGKPEDLVYRDRETKCSIQDEQNNNIKAEEIFVIEPYNGDYRSNKMSTLLVNKQLQEEYRYIHASIEKKKEEFLNNIRQYTGAKKGNDDLFVGAFKKTPKDFLPCLEKLQEDVRNIEGPTHSDIKYIDVINQKVESFLETKGVKHSISEYISKYDELLDRSAYFKKGIFNHTNASDICKNLQTNRFFEARHSVSLNTDDGKKNEINTQNELEEIIDEEKQNILQDPELEKRFKDIDDKITKNAELREFRHILENNHWIIPKLNDLDSFKRDLWISYFKKEKMLYEELLELYQNGKVKLDCIIKKAKEQSTDWAAVVEIFNDRFDVPFRIQISNQDDVILEEKAPLSVFVYKENELETEIAENELMRVLSTGEQRALYILNIIFEIRAKIKAEQKTLLIIDDIADSFDYKNKYAIVEYLKDIIEQNGFYSIILTHNFDFYRTIQSRLAISRENNCHMVIKTDTEIKLVQAQELNAFKHWKDRASKDNKILIASIPFIRNIIEYTIGDDDQDYITLTSLLHIKSNTNSVTVTKIKEIYNKVWKTNLPPDSSDQSSVISLIYNLADSCSVDGESINLENKIILSIAIRLKAEEFMINEINDDSFVQSLDSNQTARLYKRYKNIVNTEENRKILEQVILMTSENIHFNSFMYEPILDMADSHLQALYVKVKSLHA